MSVQDDQIYIHFRKTRNFCQLPWSSDIFEGDKWDSLKENIDSNVRNLVKVLDEEYAGYMRSNIRESLDSCFSGNGKQELDSDCIQKLLAYRVVDIGNFINHDAGAVSTIASDFEAKTAVCDLFPKLRQWSKIIEHCESHIKKLPDVGPIGSSDVQLYTSLCQTLSNLKGELILANFRKAAFHIRYLLQGNIDLPRKTQVIESKLLDSLQVGDLASMSLMEATWNTGRPFISSLRCPLSLASTISPLLLLLPAKLDGKGTGVEKLYQYWIGLGMSKPPSLLKAERCIWQLVWELGENPGMDLIDGIKTAIESISALTIDASKEELEWFAMPDLAPTTRITEVNSLEDNSSTCSDSALLSRPTNENSVNDMDQSDEQNLISSPLKQKRKATDLPVGETPTPAVNRNSGSRKYTNAGPTTETQSYNRVTRSQLHRTGGVGAGPSSDTRNPSRSQPKRHCVTYPQESETSEQNSTSKRVLSRRPKLDISNDSKLCMQSIEIIDLTTEYRDPVSEISMINIEESPSKLLGDRELIFLTFDGSGNFKWRPELHFKDDLEFLYLMTDSVSLSKKPEFIDIITYDEYRAQSDAVIINRLRYRHLLVTNGPKPTYGFDKTGLRKLAPMNKVITIHDHSIQLGEEDTPDRRHVAGTLNDFLTAAGNKNGKALNGLDFPISFEYEQDLPFASDKIAWHHAHGKPFCKDDCPTSSIRWALCATSGAYHRSHCDCHGHGTYISPQSGVKIWFVAVPKRKPSSDQLLDSRLFDDFGNVDLFTQNYSLDDPNTDLWDWEVVVLKPGMTFVMRPNTPHVVFTADHSVCLGGHFYATSTLRDTCYGMFHTFIAGSLITNAQHSKHAFMLLARLLAFFEHHFLGSTGFSDDNIDDDDIDLHDPIHHIPDLSTFTGILDLATLCCLMELGNVLCEWSYTDGAETERRRLMYARKRARKLIYWTFDQWELLDEQGRPVDAMEKFYWPYIAQQARALILYKRTASNNGIRHTEIPNKCTSKSVKSIVENCIMSPEPLWKIYCQSNAVDITFAWTGIWFGVSKIANPIQRDYDELAQEGYTVSDMLAFKSRIL